MKHITTILAFLVAFSSPVAGQDWAKGLAAYGAGDYATALKEWRPLAETGDVYTQSSLGFMYENGLGVPQDYNEAVKWYRLAAEQGLAAAQFNLGVRYSNGQGVAQDKKEAVKCID